jgi:transposase
VSKSWVATLVARFREGGYEAITPRSKAPKTVPHRTSSELEDEIVALRKHLGELGVDAGAETIAHHLGLRHERVPSVSTIWRVLRRRGFLTPSRTSDRGARGSGSRRSCRTSAGSPT